MTWKEFEQKVKQTEGFDENLEIGYIDFTGHFDFNEIEVFINDGEITIH